MLKIKANHIANLTDARYFAAKNVDFICFYLSDETVNINTINAIVDWIEGPKNVVCVNNAPLDTVFEVFNQCNIDFLQLDLNHLALYDYTQFCSNLIIEVNIENFDESKTELAELFKNSAIEYLQLNIFSIEINKEDLKKIIDEIYVYSKNVNIIVNASFTKEDILFIYSELPNTTLVFAGSEEEKVGLKSFEEIDALFDIIEEM